MPSKRRDKQRTRDVLSSLTDPPLLRSRVLVEPSPKIDLGVYDDRVFSPDRNARASRRDATRLMAVDPIRERKRQIFKDTKRYSREFGPLKLKVFDEAPYLDPGVKFRLPKMVAICVRRKIRREVLHALDKQKKHGRGKGSRRPKAKWNEFSLIRC